MPIQITCSCGRALRVRDEVAGKRARCPGCGNILLIPEPQTSLNADDEAASFFMTEPDPDMSRSKPTGPIAHSEPPGLAANIIYFYPPVLFLLGIGSIIRGFKGED